ncbi:MAG: hypothetical protein QHH27_03895 [Clostridia bacterium]|nr:hypothetical protein [Clostridia bacterium]MDH7572682.1 hypothetical protein [Clostridia bacterium]
MIVEAALAAAVTFLALKWPRAWPQRPNYRGLIVAQAGPAPVLGAAVALLPALAVEGPTGKAGRVLLALMVLGAVGLLDDRRGGDRVKGLKGHLRYWRKVGPDTALLKVIGGLGAGVAVVARRSLPWWEAGLEVATVALAANALNLLDLRPGRALKGFFILAGVLAGLAGGRSVPLLAPLLVAALVFFPFDLRERAMLGDAGANSLGGALGAIVTLHWGAAAELGLLAALAGLHWYAERASITRLLERVPWLARLDRLGRAAPKG